MRTLLLLAIPAVLAIGLAPRPVAAGSALAIERVVTVDRPVFVTHAPGDRDRLFVLEQWTGRILVVDRATGAVNPEPFLDLDVATFDEQGLLGLAFHPVYTDNGFLYVNYTAADNATRIERYTVSADDPDRADLASAKLILTYDQPQPNHNGGWIAFGPNDGYLYIATGDGGGANDEGPGHTEKTGNAQDLTDNLLGKILRIDVDGGDPFAIPPDNPFVGVEGDDAIWAYGLRNPWRAGFDPLTGDLYIGDVGQNAREDLNRQPGTSPGGENYGWRCMEGTLCTGRAGCSCDDERLTDPIHEIEHDDDGCNAIVGGPVYRGCAIPTLRGTVFFAEYCRQRIWSFRWEDGGITDFADRTNELRPPDGPLRWISSFGTDGDGELYVCEVVSGDVYRIIPAGPTGDVNCDGVIDFRDLLLLLAAWGPCEACPEDLNGDGQVDFADLLVVLSQWTT